MNLDRIKDLKKFLEKELEPGIDELESLSDSNRKHVQKLVYTNLVDRFDYMIDKLLLDNCREDQLILEAFKGNDQPVTESELMSLLLKGNDLQNALDERLQDKLRLSTLRQRHSRKLFTLLNLCGDIGEFDKKPRVNPSTGEISDNFKVQIRATPHSICGYADWLYARRNAIVHGAGSSKFLKNDVAQIKKYYKVDLAASFKISIASIKTALTFYWSLCELLEETC